MGDKYVNTAGKQIGTHKDTPSGYGGRLELLAVGQDVFSSVWQNQPLKVPRAERAISLGSLSSAE